MKNFAILSVVAVSAIQAVNLTAEAEAEKSYWDFEDLLSASEWEPETIAPPNSNYVSATNDGAIEAMTLDDIFDSKDD